MKFSIDKSSRQKEIELTKTVKKLRFEVSRKECRDVLVEFIDASGVAMSKPLNKCLGEIKLKNISKIRFTMNEMSVKPIEITIVY